MKITEVKKCESLSVRLVGFKSLNADMEKEICGDIRVKGEFVTITDFDGFETEIHHEEIKDIIIL